MQPSNKIEFLICIPVIHISLYASPQYYSALRNKQTKKNRKEKASILSSQFLSNNFIRQKSIKITFFSIVGLMKCVS